MKEVLLGLATNDYYSLLFYLSVMFLDEGINNVQNQRLHLQVASVKILQY